MMFTVAENKVRARMIMASKEGFKEVAFRIEEFANEKAYEEAKAFANACGWVADYGTGFVLSWRKA